MSTAAEKYKPQASGFFEMKDPGEYRVRILSELEPIMKAPYREQDPTKQKLETKTVFLCRVLDRADGTLKLWEMGWSIYQQYLALSKDQDYHFEDYPNYDIKISKIKTGPEKQNVKYNILPSPVLALTQAELDLAAAAKSIIDTAGALQRKEAEKMMALGINPDETSSDHKPQKLGGQGLGRPLVEGDEGYVSEKDIPF